MEGGRLWQPFWRGKRVLVTGHTGFKGAWLCLLLKELGAEVVGFARDIPTQPALFELAHLDEDLRSIRGDVRNYEHVRTTVREAQPEIVIHMAAQSLVRRSYRDPLETFATNVMGTAHVLEAVRQTAGVQVAIVVTSDKCYENQDAIHGFAEKDPLGGDDPYSSSKGCAELVAAAYRASFFSSETKTETAIATVRSGNVIGGGDWAEDRLVPDCMRAFAEGQPASIRNPLFVRPWQHVLEPLKGYLMLAEKLWDAPGKFCEAWNFGPRDEDAQPVSVIADRLTELWEGNASWELAVGEQPHEAHSLKLNCDKAREELRWWPRTTLDTALQWTVQWYQAFQNGLDARSVSQQQICQFLGTKKPLSTEVPTAGFAKAG
jgi:CDP-glucose 4,6-dehydratase